MSTDTSLRKSPKGDIFYMAAANPVTNEKTGKEEYGIRLGFDVTADKEFLDWVTSINDAKVVTAQSYRGKKAEIKAYLNKGKALVSATTQFKPEVVDSKGNALEDAPFFFSDSTGVAQMIVQPYNGQKGGTINLMGIKIHSIENPEGTSTGVSREERTAQLRAMAAED